LSNGDLSGVLRLSLRGRREKNLHARRDDSGMHHRHPASRLVVIVGFSSHAQRNASLQVLEMWLHLGLLNSYSLGFGCQQQPGGVKGFMVQ